MARLIILLLCITLIKCSVKTPGQSASVCKNFEKEIKASYTAASSGHYASSSDSLLLNINGKYKECIIGKDTTHTVALLGRHYGLMVGGFGRQLHDSLGLKYTMEFVVTTPSYPLNEVKPYGQSIILGVDNLNIVRVLRIGRVNGRGIQ